MTVQSPSYSRSRPSWPASEGKRKTSRNAPLPLLPVIPCRSIAGVYCASTKSRCEWLETRPNRTPKCGYYGTLYWDAEQGRPTRDDMCLRRRAPSRASQGRQLAPDLVLKVEGPKTAPEAVQGLTKAGTSITARNHANGVATLRIDHRTVLVEEVLHVIRMARADPLMDQAVADRIQAGKVRQAARQLIGTVRDLFSGQDEKIKAEFEAAIKSLESEMEDERD